MFRCPPVNGPKDPWPCVLSLPGAQVVCWRPHLASTRQYYCQIIPHFWLLNYSLKWKKITFKCCICSLVLNPKCPFFFEKLFSPFALFWRPICPAVPCCRSHISKPVDRCQILCNYISYGGSMDIVHHLLLSKAARTIFYGWRIPTGVFLPSRREKNKK